MANLARALTVWEKRNYPFRRWRDARPGTVVFPGCSFPSFFPKTLRALRAACERAGASMALDCCGLPLAGLAGQRAFEDVRSRVAERLSRVGATELVAVCPNCEDALAPTLGLPVGNVYVWLSRAGIGTRAEGEGRVFVPCPDRAKRRWLADARAFLPLGAEELPCGCCCGAAFAVERPQEAAAAARRVLAAACDPAFGSAAPRLFVYCASCAGQLERVRRTLSPDDPAAQVRIVHVLSAALGVEERPAVRTSVANRAGAALR